MSLTLEDFGKQYVLTLKGKMSHRVELGKDPKGNLIRIDNALAGMETRLAHVQEKLDSLYARFCFCRQEPFFFEKVVNRYGNNAHYPHASEQGKNHPAVPVR